MKPIIMSTEDVRGILDGRKTMKRMVIKPQPTHWDDGERVYDKDSVVGPEFYNPIRVDKDGEQYPGKEIYGIYSDDGEYGCKAPCQPGDVLWVRETWKPQDYSFVDNVMSCQIIFKAGGPDNLNPRVFWNHGDDTVFESCGTWRSPVTMPRSAARLFLRVKDVRVERVQDILCGDMKREGVIPKTVTGGQYQQWQNDYFKPAWDARNAKRGFGWDSNPFVWVISFERLE